MTSCIGSNKELALQQCVGYARPRVVAVSPAMVIRIAKKESIGLTEESRRVSHSGTADLHRAECAYSVIPGLGF